MKQPITSARRRLFPGSVSFPDGVEVSQQVCVEDVYQTSIRVDHGSRFMPRTPTDNVLVGPFNSKFLLACLNAQLLLSLDDAARKMGNLA